MRYYFFFPVFWYRFHFKHEVVGCLKKMLKIVLFYRKTSETEPLRRLRRPNPRPMDFARRSGPGMARSLPQVPGMPPIPRRVLYVFRQGRQDVLQKGLCKVMRHGANVFIISH